MYSFTSESVSKGHPDKVADQISDAILDACIAYDPNARVACEVMIKSNLLVIAGEISTAEGNKIPIDHTQIAKNTLQSIGYDRPEFGFDFNNYETIIKIDEQSDDIKVGVDEKKSKEQGAGDQGLMFGFATNETPNLMPAPIFYSHLLMEQQAKVRLSEKDIGPDAKAQITFRYAHDHTPLSIEKIVLSTQHTEALSYNQLRELVMETIILPTIPKELMPKDTMDAILINPTGRFIVGGPKADCGLTGRKIIVDTYGGFSRHGGGAFSGKDPSKVDRSAAYMARYIAKNIVAANIADRCEVQLSYAIGKPNPLSIYCHTFGTEKIDLQKVSLVDMIQSLFDLSPKGIIETLDLLRPIYQPLASHGHFGRCEETYLWEKTNLSQQIQQQSLSASKVTETCL